MALRVVDFATLVDHTISNQPFVTSSAPVGLAARGCFVTIAIVFLIHGLFEPGLEVERL